MRLFHLQENQEVLQKNAKANFRFRALISKIASEKCRHAKWFIWKNH
jgi:hypothetical protein